MAGGTLCGWRCRFCLAGGAGGDRLVEASTPFSAGPAVFLQAAASVQRPAAAALVVAAAALGAAAAGAAAVGASAAVALEAATAAYEAAAAVEAAATVVLAAAVGLLSADAATAVAVKAAAVAATAAPAGAVPLTGLERSFRFSTQETLLRFSCVRLHAFARRFRLGALKMEGDGWQEKSKH